MAAWALVPWGEVGVWVVGARNFLFYFWGRALVPAVALGKKKKWCTPTHIGRPNYPGGLDAVGFLIPSSLTPLQPASGREREVSSEYCVSCWNVHSKVGLFIANPGIHINCFRSLPREPVACRLLQHPWI